MMTGKPALRVVGGTEAKVARPDTEAKRLLRQRLRLEAELRRVNEALFAHRRRKATEHGRIPPLSMDELIAELGISR